MVSTSVDSRKLSEELNLKIRLLGQKHAVLDELLLHKSKQTDQAAASYYVDVMNNYGNFFRSVELSLKTSLYVDLHALLGVTINNNDQLIQDKNGRSSIFSLALTTGNKMTYENIISKHEGNIIMISKVRHAIAHATSQDELANLFVPSYISVVKLLNEVAEFVMAIHDEQHGVAGYNEPHRLEINNEYADDTERLIYSISTTSKREKYRKQYLNARKLIHEESRKLLEEDSDT